MSKYLKELNSDEKQSILEQYSKFMISEQSAGTGGYTPDYQWDSKIDKLLSANSFKTGMSDINQGTDLNNAIKYLMNFSGKPLTIIGGASAVGSNTGFDNKGLAEKRAQNLIKYAKDQGIDTSKWDVKSVVGKATQKGPDADAEQFVGVQQKQGGPKITGMKQDMTGVAPKPMVGGAKGGINPNVGGQKMTIEITAPPRFLDELKRAIMKAKQKTRPGEVMDKYSGYNASFGGGNLNYFN